ncbi:uncharacterized protein LOC128998945 [Macrosteles quadrilineatus]|uniref:uncharacterized protein LOC128998945 n=1 Tax=Macrosteles quadrilineatus TaxID=74068 RepID=UPI0023E2C359|nr:uncharacterized protein LOC128998945 [Macrosteles quadrilineatus]
MTPNISDSLVSPHQSMQTNLKENNTVLLGTLLVKISSSSGEPHVFRALLDSGSMCNLITAHAARILSPISNYQESINIYVTTNRGQILIDLQTMSGKMVVEAQPALVLEKLTVDVPPSSISSKVTQLTQQYNLADPSFHIPNRIDLIIGNAILPQLLTQNQFSLGPNLPTALGTHFGFVLMGTTPCSLTNPLITNNIPTTSLNVCLLSKSDIDWHASLQSFWVQEEPPTSPSLTHEEALCDQHFVMKTDVSLFVCLSKTPQIIF